MLLKVTQWAPKIEELHEYRPVSCSKSQHELCGNKIKNL